VNIGGICEEPVDMTIMPSVTDRLK